MKNFVLWIFRAFFRVFILLLLFYFILKPSRSSHGEVQKSFVNFRVQSEGKPSGNGNLEWAGEKNILNSVSRYIKGFFDTGPTYFEQLEKIDENLQNKHISRFQRVAVIEQKKFGVPASVTIANSLLLGQAGQSDLVARGNNYFAIPATSDWVGDTLIVNNVVYRKYENAWSSFRDHSYYLTTGRNASLRKAADDYRGWARQMGKKVYDRRLGLDQQIIAVIEKYGLDKLDSLE